MRISTLLVLMTVAVSSFVQAEGLTKGVTLDAKGDQLCQRIQSCAWQHLDADNLPEESQQALKQSLGSICSSIKGDLPPVRELHIERRAEACIDSMLSQSCDQLVAGSAPTQPCQQLAEELAKR